MKENLFIRTKNLFSPYKKREFKGYELQIFSIINRIINLIIFIIFKIFNLKFLPIPMEAIGHQIFDLECFLYENKKKKFNFKPVILGGKNFVANHFLFENYQKKKHDFIIVRNNILCMILFFQKNKENIIYDIRKYQASHEYREMHSIFKKKPFFYSLNKEHKKKAEDILKRFKIKLKKDFVVIHARDSSYKKFDGESYRNSSIENFRKSSEWLIKKNIQIVRIGNRGMVKCSFSKKIIDTTKVNFKTHKDLIDLYLIENCKFLIGSASGPYIIASAFNKPMLLVDMAPLGNVFPCAKRGISLPKLYKNKDDKLIKFKEILSNKFSHLRLDVQFAKNNIKLVNNTSNEIFTSTKEILKKVEKNNFKEDLLQKRFKKLLLSYKIDSAIANTSISSSFIKKYRKLL